MVNKETLFYGLRLVILSQHKAGSAFIADPLLRRLRIYSMVRGSACKACAAAGHPCDDAFIGNIHINGMIDGRSAGL